MDFQTEKPWIHRSMLLRSWKSRNLELWKRLVDIAASYFSPTLASFSIFTAARRNAKRRVNGGGRGKNGSGTPIIVRIRPEPNLTGKIGTRAIGNDTDRVTPIKPKKIASSNVSEINDTETLAKRLQRWTR